MSESGVVKFRIQPFDSSVQGSIPKKNRSEGERGVRNTWIPQCHIQNLCFITNCIAVRLCCGQMGEYF